MNPAVAGLRQLFLVVVLTAYSCFVSDWQGQQGLCVGFVEVGDHALNGLLKVVDYLAGLAGSCLLVDV